MWNTKTFLRPKFWRSLLRLFLRPNLSRSKLRPKFSRMIPILILDQIFRDRYWDFFWDQYWDFYLILKFSRPLLRLFFRPIFFDTDTNGTDTLKRMRKVSIPRSLQSRCHTLGVPMICPSYAHHMLEICLRYAHDMPEICPRYAWDMPKVEMMIWSGGKWSISGYLGYFKLFDRKKMSGSGWVSGARWALLGPQEHNKVQITTKSWAKCGTFLDYVD